MSINEALMKLEGRWRGTNRLNLSWMPVPIKESPSTAVVTPRIAGQCLEIAYTWEYESTQREGLIIINATPASAESDAAHAVWTDSWHSANVIMMCAGTLDVNGRLNVKGSYSVPEHPDWGWRTEIIPGDDSFRYLMFNVTPDGVEEWAVETEFKRA
jgi:hypothetical protein